MTHCDFHIAYSGSLSFCGSASSTIFVLKTHFVTDVALISGNCGIDSLGSLLRREYTDSMISLFPDTFSFAPGRMSFLMAQSVTLMSPDCSVHWLYCLHPARAYSVSWIRRMVVFAL